MPGKGCFYFGVTSYSFLGIIISCNCADTRCWLFLCVVCSLALFFVCFLFGLFGPLL